MFSSRSLFCSVFLLTLVFTSTESFAKVESVKGKRYVLSPQHGPWMIMAATFRDVPIERRTKTGLTAWQAADEMVYALRKLGVPAYTYLQDMKMGELKEFSSDAANGDEKRYIAQHEAIAVLAGNFSSPEDKNAQAIMDYLKKEFDPEFLKDESNGGIFAKTPGRPKPLSHAHMTVNPLMDPDDVKKNSMDPLVRKLNRDMEYSLLKCKGKYTLRIATFEGNAIVQVGNQSSGKAQQHFDKMMGNSLDSAGDKAWELTEVLRSATKLGYDRNYEAYIYHDRYKSIVTVGSFDSPNDPVIAQLAEQFRGKQRTYEGKDVLTAEIFTIPKNLKPGIPPEKIWMFDVRPKLEDVPKSR